MKKLLELLETLLALITKFPDVLKGIIKSLFIKISLINWTQILGTAAILIGDYGNMGILTPSKVILFTSLITLLLKIFQSNKEIVATGFQVDWSVYLLSVAGLIFGFIDTIFANGQLVMELFGDNAKYWTMAYLFMVAYFRTGFSNQSAQSVAARKLGK